MGECIAATAVSVSCSHKAYLVVLTLSLSLSLSLHLSLSLSRPLALAPALPTLSIYISLYLSHPLSLSPPISPPFNSTIAALPIHMQERPPHKQFSVGSKAPFMPLAERLTFRFALGPTNHRLTGR